MKILYLLAFLFLLGCTTGRLPEKGVSYELALERKEMIDSLEYELFFSIPGSKPEKITGSNHLRFWLNRRPERIILDFRESSDHLNSVSVNGAETENIFENEHIILPGKSFKKGRNTVELEFIAGDLSLNRQEDFMYTLFVPDRARTAFPCFDQPDMKASFSLSLEIPADWTACANGAAILDTVRDDRKYMKFGQTRPLSTYLFAFAAGKFEMVERTKNDFTVNLFHRETDRELIDHNMDEIYRQVFSSLEWMEKFTGIKYPFAKYDLIAIPSFQYNGMEHTGATLYRSSSLFLPLTATDNQLMGRANLVAHETAHMWFGDLVTMKWFNEVWLKEVFANFIAEKITNPWFPDTDHDLKFLLAHYPLSYEIDRSRGANPVQQELDNLENAGTIYGSIIYHKAPLVMRKLEEITGEDLLQEGLQEYLEQFAYSNAGWDDLIRILDGKTRVDLASWSKVWIEEPGMPVYKVSGNETQNYAITQTDPEGRGRVWPDKLRYLGKDTTLSVEFGKSGTGPVLLDEGAEFLNSDGSCYGYFKPDMDIVGMYLGDFVEHYMETGELTHASQWIIINENLLDNRLSPSVVLSALNKLIHREQDNLVLQYMLNMQRMILWDLLLPSDMMEQVIYSSKVLWDEFYTSKGSRKKMLLDAIVQLELQVDKLNEIEQIWKQGSYEDLILSEADMVDICYELCLKLPDRYSSLAEFQLERTMNKDRKASLEFILPALDPDIQVRDVFFESLKNPDKREIESDVITALHYLNHPLRREQEIPHLRDCLDILPEIQMTGDIFFPKRWLDAVFTHHNSGEACDTVTGFLEENPDLPDYLKLKILQSTDMMYRANRIIETKTGKPGEG